jgi:Na+-transporting methylmalonyl-CoA/oxaloacetate decarboxylase gamma subunit
MNNLLLSLEITALGMGLVFGAIILLWWMMALLTSITREKESVSDQTDNAPVMERNVKAQAAVVAVAVALADHQVTHAHPLSDPPTAIISAWQLGMRTRQLSEKGTPIVRKLRNVG